LFTTKKVIFAVGEVRRKVSANGNVWCVEKSGCALSKRAVRAVVGM
jgi:hypothetical protein